jgi:hypothetical protein
MSPKSKARALPSSHPSDGRPLGAFDAPLLQHMLQIDTRDYPDGLDSVTPQSSLLLWYQCAIFVQLSRISRPATIAKI